MRIDVVTIFPQIFASPIDHSILKRAQEKDAVEIHLHDLRDFTSDRHRQVDDTPYGGGPGMVMMAPPFFEAAAALAGGPAGSLKEQARVILLSPQGRQLTQRLAAELAREPRLVLLCGRYEGVDVRVEETLASDVVSIGDYILTGGEIPALVLIDAVARLLPGVLGGATSAEEETFADGLLEHPQYTRPEDFEGMGVPEVLLSGNHKEISRWRREQSLLLTYRRRPDLLAAAKLKGDDFAFLSRLSE